MSARVSFADLLKAGAKKDKQRLALKLAVATPPTAKPVAPEKDFTRVANSIAREAVPNGLFSGKSKQIYDYLYLITRGAIQPKRSVRITKTNLMKNADIGSERTLLKNLRHLKSLGLIKITEYEGQREGNEYETFLPEEIQSKMPPHPTPPHPPHPRQKVGTPPPAESGVGGVGQTIENKTTYETPKTSLKDFKEIDDEPAAPGAPLYARGNASDYARGNAFGGVMEKLVNEISKKTTGEELKISDEETLKELAEVLTTEFEIAVAHAKSISNVPAFLTEHLRRRLAKKTDDKTSGKNPARIVPTGVLEDRANQSDLEPYRAEPLTERARQTVLETLSGYAKTGQHEFITGLQSTYTAEDWKWLSDRLPAERKEK